MPGPSSFESGQWTPPLLLTAVPVRATSVHQYLPRSMRPTPPCGVRSTAGIKALHSCANPEQAQFPHLRSAGQAPGVGLVVPVECLAPGRLLSIG